LSWLYPHSVTVYAVTQASGTSNVAQKPVVAGSGTTVACDVQAKTPGDVAKDFGFDLNEPAYLYCASSDLATFVPRYRVAFGSQVFTVENVMSRNDGDADTAYGFVVLNSVTH